MSTDNKEYFEVATASGSFKTLYTTAAYRRRKAWQPANPKQVVSHIPGTVTQMNVAVGDSVNVGDDLFVFKAMKMNSVVKSDMAGKIKSINVTLNESVPKGAVIVEFE